MAEWRCGYRPSWLALVLVVSETLAESREREREREEERRLVSTRVMFS